MIMTLTTAQLKALYGFEEDACVITKDKTCMITVQER